MTHLNEKMFVTMQGKKPAQFTLLIIISLIFSACSTADQNEQSLELEHQLLEEYLQENYDVSAENLKFGIETVKLNDQNNPDSFQVFKIIDGVFENETFLIYDQTVYQLGTAFGGWGVNSILPADINGDGYLELIFTYSFGSGIHQSGIGCFSTVYKDLGILEADMVYYGDIMLQNEDGHITVYSLFMDQQFSFSLDQLIGTVQILEDISGNPFVHFEPLSDLPEGIMDNIQTLRN